MLRKTFELLRGWKVGEQPPEPAFDADEITALGGALKRLLYAPSSLRKRLQSLGATIVPANFYSEIPTIENVEKSFADGVPSYYDRCFDAEEMINFLEILHVYCSEFDPPETAPAGQYSWKGGQFSYSDAMSYYCMVRHCKPRTIIEVGSGWSTLVADEAIRRNGHGRIVCVEPFPPDFLPSIASLTELVQSPAQDLPTSFFDDQLEDGDILFIDSTHTVKHASDCLHLYLRVLPEIQSRIFVHAHDIYLPEPMPRSSMIDRNLFWTEQYLLYAYLLDNARTRTLYGSRWHFIRNREKLEMFMQGRYPAGGASFWFEQDGAWVDVAGDDWQQS